MASQQLLQIRGTYSSSIVLQCTNDRSNAKLFSRVLDEPSVPAASDPFQGHGECGGHAYGDLDYSICVLGWPTGEMTPPVIWR